MGGTEAHLSSSETPPLPFFQIVELRNVVRRVGVRFDHLVSHIVEPRDEVVDYWIDHVRRGLMAIGDELDILIYDERENFDG